MYKRNKSTRRSKGSKGTSKRSKSSKRSKGTSKRTSRRHTRKNNRHYTRKGGNYTQQTEMTLEGVPLEKDAVVTVDGVGSMSIQQFKDYVNNKDLHPRS